MTTMPSRHSSVIWTMFGLSIGLKLLAYVINHDTGTLGYHVTSVVLRLGIYLVCCGALAFMFVTVAKKLRHSFASVFAVLLLIACTIDIFAPAARRLANASVHRTKDIDSSIAVARVEKISSKVHEGWTEFTVRNNNPFYVRDIKCRVKFHEYRLVTQNYGELPPPRVGTSSGAFREGTTYDSKTREMLSPDIEHPEYDLITVHDDLVSPSTEFTIKVYYDSLYDRITQHPLHGVGSLFPTLEVLDVKKMQLE